MSLGINTFTVAERSFYLRGAVYRFSSASSSDSANAAPYSSRFTMNRRYCDAFKSRFAQRRWKSTNVRSFTTAPGARVDAHDRPREPWASAAEMLPKRLPDASQSWLIRYRLSIYPPQPLEALASLASLMAMSDRLISTPCVKVCIVDGGTGLCLGCGRTLAEIAAWGGMDEGRRLSIMSELPARLIGVEPAR